jgi:hypothetical protein
MDRDSNMKIVFAILSFLTFGFATPTLAQAPAPADIKVVTDCLKKAAEDGSFGGGCIGVVADPCIKIASTKNSYIEDGKKCATRENTVWIELMRRELADVGKGAPGKSLNPIKDAQKSFAQSRDAFCPHFDNVDPEVAKGGSIYCRMQENARRTLLLRLLATAVNPH